MNMNNQPNRCEGCDKAFGDGPDLAKTHNKQTRKTVCVNCERWQYRHPELTMADRRRRLFGPAGGAATTAPAIVDPHWRQRAACKGVNPELFDVDEDVPSYSKHHAYAAAVFCRNCPVRIECLTDARVNPDYSLGLRGGIYFPLSKRTSTKQKRKPIDLIAFAERQQDLRRLLANTERNRRNRERRAAAREQLKNGAA